MYSRGVYTRACTLAVAAMIGSTGIALGTVGNGVAAGSSNSLRAAALSAQVRAAVTAARQHQAIPSHYRPRLAGISKLADLGACNYKRPVRRLCERGDVDSDRTLVVFGDSHARHWIPAINKAAIRHGYAAYFLVKPGCNASEMRRANSAGARVCDSFRRWAIRKINALRPDLLVIAGDIPDVAVGDDGTKVRRPASLARLYARGVTRHVRQVARTVGDVVMVADTPDRQVTPKACLSRPTSDLHDCAFKPDRQAGLELWAARKVANSTSARLVNPRRWFCYHDLCPVIVGDVIPYRDLEHMTTLYSGKLAPAMAQVLRLEER